MPIYFGLMNVHTAGTLTIHYTSSISPMSIDCLCISLMLDIKAKLGQVRPSFTNEVEAHKLFPVFEVFRFDTQVGFCSNLNRVCSTLYFKLTLS